MSWGASDQWPELGVLPSPDYLSVSPTDCGEARVYVRRYSGERFHVVVGNIACVTVDPEFRGRGWGSWLVKDCVRWCREQRLSFSLLNCDEELVGFYARLGFFPVANVKGPGVTMVNELDGVWRGVPVDFREPW